MKFSTFLYKVGGNAEIFDYFCNRLRTMNMRRTEVVNQISKAIRKVDPTATAILYGSEARGDARSDSDIEIRFFLCLGVTRIRINEHEYSRNRFLLGASGGGKL